jgi:PAS domain S-box-containing protein
MTEQPETDGESGASPPRESDLLALIEGSPHGIVIARGMPPRPVFANAAFTKILGYTLEELLDRSPEGILEVVHPEDRQPFLERFQQRQEGQTRELPFQLRAFRKDGSLRWLSIYGNRIRYKEEPAVQATVIDITKQVEATEALEKSEEKYRALAEQSIQGLAVVTGDPLRIVFANRALGEIVGLSAEAVVELSLERIASIIHPEDQRVLSEYYRARMAGKPLPDQYRFRIVRDDGALRWLEVLPRKIEWGGEPAVQAAVLDITDQKGAVEALRESEDRFKKIFENAMVGIYRTTPDGQILMANPALLAMLGYASFEELAERNLEEEGYEPEYPRSLFKTRIEEEGRIRGLEASWIRKDGTLLFIRESAWAFRDAAGKTLYYEGTVEDITVRKQAVRALEVSEEKFRLVFEEAKDAIFWANPQTGLIVNCNKAAEILLERKKKDILGLHQTELHAPDKKAEYAQVFERHFQDGGAIDDEAEVITESGKTVPVHISASIISVGNTPVLQGIFRDITERKRAEAALRAREDLFRTLAESTSAGIFIYRGENNVYVNPTSAEITGYTVDELLQMNAWEVIHPDHRALVQERALSRQEGADVPSRYEVKILTKDGETRWLDFTAARIEYRDEPAVVGTVFDITQRKEAEEALAESEEKFKSLSDDSPNMIFINKMGRIVYANARCSEIMGYSREAFLAEDFDFLTLIVPEYRDMIKEHFQAHLRGKENPAVEYELVTKAGKRVDAILSTKLIDYEGERAILGTVIDISERKSAEEERRRFEAQIQHAQKLESLGVLAGGIAHDFNNLLTGVLGNADLALLELKRENPARPFLEEIRVTSKRLADLTKQMLAYSGKGRFVVEPLDLCALVEEMTHLLHVSISKNVEIKFDFQPRLPAIEADATQVRQVIMNLISNASEAIGENPGVISVRVHVREADRALLAASYLDEGLPEGPYIALEVSDTGVGMEEQTLARIFDPFFSTKFTGRGLGLAAVLGIVRGHKGSIGVRSEPGKGTTFLVLFPCLDATCEELAPREVRRSPPPRGSGTVLVVDDERIVRSVAKVMLERAGYRPRLAADGEEAMRILRRETGEIDAVLLDLTMPHMGGVEVFVEMKKIRPELPIVLISGYAEEDAMEQFGETGLAGFIQKPFEVESFLGSVRNVTRKEEEEDPS